MDQAGAGRFYFPLLADSLHHMLLLRVERHGLLSRRLDMDGISINRVHLNLQKLHVFQATDHRGRNIELRRHQLPGKASLLQKGIEEPVASGLMFLFKKGKALPGLFLRYRQQYLLFLFWFFLFSYRNYGFQSLDHRGAVVIPYPGRQSDKSGLHAHAVGGDGMNGLDTLRSDLRPVRGSNHIALDEAVAPAKGNLDHHSRKEFPLKFFGNPVLKGFIQLFVGNIHDDIGISQRKFSSSRIS